LFRPEGSYRTPVRSVLVLSHGAVPSSDLYLAARLEGYLTRYVDTRLAAPDAALLPEGTYVVIVRHSPRPWLKLLFERRARLSGVGYLLDDDIPDALGCPDLPFYYALKTAYRYQRTRRLLAAVCDAIWVSTPYLLEKYRDSGPRLLEPLYLGAPFHAKSHAVTYFYHGTSSHRREVEFLVEVVRAVQARLENAHFEIIGGSGIRRLFRGIPRVRVQHPMTWPDFLAYTASVHHAVGLAPMLDTHFNQARSHNKLYDITRSGAAGIYSDVAVYRRNVHAGCGVLVPNDVAAWVDEVCRLLADAEARQAIYRNALAWCEGHAEDPGFKLCG
jgi:glycosyltransferase involved in cell wall biosynthesis